MFLLAIDWSALFANIGQFILAFSILIVLHELGHFLPAKWFGCRVEKFYLFFNPWFSLFKKKVGETEYGLGWIPLGGYVKISGMMDESMDKEQLKQPPQPWEFRSKPAWQRLIIMLGGVTVNFLLALVLFAMILFIWGEERLPVSNLKYGLWADSLALKAGIKNGDVITNVNGKQLKYYDELFKEVTLTDKVNLVVRREGRDTAITMPAGFIQSLTKNQLKGFVRPRTPVYVDTTLADSVYYPTKNTLQKGDHVIAVNGTPFEYNNEFTALRQNYKKQVVSITAENNGVTREVPVKLDSNGLMPNVFRPAGQILGTDTIRYSFFQAIPAGAKSGVQKLKDYMTGLGLLFTSKEHKVKDNLGSVISIGKTFGGVWDWQHFWTMTALFSIILAFMNILPIPALDGGHALFTIYEMITGRKPSDKFMEYAQIVGFVLLLTLMVYALGLDVWRLFTK